MSEGQDRFVGYTKDKREFLYRELERRLNEVVFQATEGIKQLKELKGKMETGESDS